MYARCLFSVVMVRVLPIFLLVNPWNRNRLRTFLEKIVSQGAEFFKRFNQRERCENERRSGRPTKTDDRGDGKILRCVKTEI
jgi:transposase-like protein